VGTLPPPPPGGEEDALAGPEVDGDSAWAAAAAAALALAADDGEVDDAVGERDTECSD
jgi:hypothetical protein